MERTVAVDRPTRVEDVERHMALPFICERCEWTTAEAALLRLLLWLGQLSGCRFSLGGIQLWLGIGRDSDTDYIGHVFWSKIAIVRQRGEASASTHRGASAPQGVACARRAGVPPWLCPLPSSHCGRSPTLHGGLRCLSPPPGRQAQRARQCPQSAFWAVEHQESGWTRKGSELPSLFLQRWSPTLGEG